MKRLSRATLFIALLLIFWAVRITALEVLPLHNDEGLHLTRAVEVWNLHPFWEIRDGKIINHFLIAAFYPQNTPVFVGRIATIFVSMLGLAAGYALIQRWLGVIPAVFAGMLWIASPYLHFFERLALSDAEAGALVVVAMWAAWHLAARGTLRHAIITGLALAAAMLFKFTAIPFTLLIALIVLLLAHYSLAQRIRILGIIGVVVVMCFIPPLAYLILRGDDLFSIALAWIGVGSGSGESSLQLNLTALAAYFLDFGFPIWNVITGIGLVLLIGLKRRIGTIIVVSALLPLLIILVFGREVLPRHVVVALPTLLTLGGAGVGAWVQTQQRRSALSVILAVVLVGTFIPFMLHVQLSPQHARLPAAVRSQYITDHSGGYGLREAVLELPTLMEPNAVVIASMFPDSCHRANFYAQPGYTLTCTEAPGLDAINSVLQTHDAVYVLVESAPLIGVDVQGIPAISAEPVARYARPGDPPDTPSVVLWRLEGE